MKRSTARRLFRWCVVSFISLILCLGLSYLWLCWQRPPRSFVEQPLFQGVTYRRGVIKQPRPVMVHIVTINLRVPGIKLLVTPGDAAKGRETLAQTTTNFLKKYGVQVAINGGFFEPFYSHSPWDYYPRSGDPVNMTGLAIANGITYSTAGRKQEPVFCVGADNWASIRRLTCPSNTLQAISGNFMLVENGLLVAPADHAIEPRTAICLESGEQILHFLIVDGRQPSYSEGVRFIELAQLALRLGCDQAFNLDGGGSTTLAYATRWGTRLLNAPIHTRIPMRQRAVGNHLGVYALSLVNR